MTPPPIESLPRSTSPAVRRGRGPRAVLAGLAIACVAGVGGFARGGEEPSRKATVAVLDLPDGGFLVGEWLTTPAADAPGEPARGDAIRWQAADFARPFTFPLAAIRGIRFPGPAGDEGGADPLAGQERWRLELAGGDELVGRLVSIDGEYVVVQTAVTAAPRDTGGPDGVVRVKRQHVRGIRRASGRDLLPPVAPLAHWRQTPAESWRDDGGRIVTDGRRGMLFRDCDPPARCRYDVVVSWVGRPALEIGFDVEGDEPAPYRLLLGATGIVAVRDEGRGAGPRAALDSAGELPDNRLEVAVFVDREEGRLAVLLAGADGPAVDLRVPPTAGREARGLRLTATQGAVALEGLRMSEWRGDVPRVTDGGAGEVQLRDGTTMAGAVTRMDAVGGTLGLGSAADGVGAAAVRTIAVDQVESIVLPIRQGNPEPADAGPPGRNVRIVDRLGSRLTGALDRVEQGVVWIDCAGIDGRLPLSIDTLAALMSREPPTAAPPLPGRVGRIRTSQAVHRGCLVSGVEPGGRPSSGSDAVAWQPLGSLTASPLSEATDAGQPEATIDYVERAAAVGGPAADAVAGIGCQIAATDGRPVIAGLLAASAARAAGVEAGDVVLAVAARGDGRFVDTDGLSLEDVQHLLRGRAGSTVQLRLARGGPPAEPREIAIVRRPMPQLGRSPQLLRAALEAHDRLVPMAAAPAGADDPDGASESVLFLRTGERVPCRLESVGEAGLVVRLSGRQPVTVPHEAVQALEVIPAVGRPITAEKFRSLTTLPRFHESAPPTHLVRSPAGDYLRGRLVSLDERSLRIAVEADPRGKPLAIPRELVARVIWLHPGDLDSDRPEAEAAPQRPTPGGAAVQHASPDGLAVEGVAADGGRLHMTVTGVDANVLSGTNPVLGPCQIDLGRTDRLLIGRAIRIDAESRPLPYSQWRLRPAAEPRNLPSRRGTKAAAENTPGPESKPDTAQPR